jgi:gluconokinase
MHRYFLYSGILRFMQYFIGVDIGTTHTKAVIINTEGQVLQEIKASYLTRQPQPGYSEQDPEEVLTAVLRVIQKTVAVVPEKDNIQCIAFSAGMHSLMAVNKNGQPITGLLTWADIRSNKYAAKLKQTARGQEIYDQTGTPIHPMTPLCKIAWIKYEMPLVFAETYKFISMKEYVMFKLSGEYLVDYSIASASGLFDNRLLQWSSDAMEFAGITTNQLSIPVSPTHIIKSFSTEFGKSTGLSKNTVIVVGAGDGCLANLGSGAVLPGEAAITIGTSGAARKFSEQPITGTSRQLFNYLVDDTTYLCGGGINNGGNTLKWFAHAFLKNDFTTKEDFAAFMQEAATVPAGSDGLVFLPYIYGERAPVWDANAKGVFFGITAAHTQAHFMRSILEAICFALLQVLQLMEENSDPINTVYVSGGFIESPLWLQILTDIVNKKVKVFYGADASAMGAAFLGMKAMGLIEQWSDAKQFIATNKEFIPVAANYQHYMQNFSVYEHLYDKLKDDF